MWTWPFYMCAVMDDNEHTKPNCIRGYLVYQNIWSPYLGEILTYRRQPENVKDRYAVSTHKGSGEVVGHLPKKVSKMYSLFIHRGGTVTCEVTG